MPRHPLLVLALTASAASAAAAQPAASPASASVASSVPAPAAQIAAAVLPLPESLREGATVLGYGADGKLATLRRGSGPMVCLADDPRQEQFHAACYHESLEPFMARGRALRASGVQGDRVDSTRFAEVRAGRLRMPTQPAMLYSLTGAAGSHDAATGEVKGARPLFVTYIPNATAASTGLSARPAPGIPWIMYPGTPKAHIMYTPGM
jgi:hypothetical protein